jgi:hypothetical protein
VMHELQQDRAERTLQVGHSTSDERLVHGQHRSPDRVAPCPRAASRR